MKELYTDEELIKNYKNGDTDSIDFLLTKYKSLASKIARSYFLMGSEPEDLLQEAMIGLYKSCNSYNNNCNTKFSTYASTCINNQIQSAIRTANTNKNKVLNNSISLNNLINNANDTDSETTLLYIPSDEKDPENILIENERVNQIHSVMDKELSSKERLVLKHYLDGYSYSEIANKLNLSSKSVDNAITRAKTKLNKALKNL